MLKVGAATLIKNEAHWVGFSVMAAKDIVYEFVYFDGNSTDGTPELLSYIANKYGINIKVYKDKDPKDLRDDYVRLFNECINELRTDYVWFLHPDQIIVDGPGPNWKMGPLAFTVNMRSFAGYPQGDIYELIQGRGKMWKNIMRKDFGLHYFGHYGSQEEDMYFEEITGDEHVLHEDFTRYPYEIADSGIFVHHYSDVRPYSRRLGRMVECMSNQAKDLTVTREVLVEAAKKHPRVSFKPNDIYGDFKFKKFVEFPDVFAKHATEFADVLSKKPMDLLYLPITVCESV